MVKEFDCGERGIKPWAQSSNDERLDPYSGLPLLLNFDKVFDLGYISFEESGKMRLSKYLEDYQALGIKPAMSVSLSYHQQHYMAHHRKEVFKQ